MCVRGRIHQTVRRMHSSFCSNGFHACNLKTAAALTMTLSCYRHSTMSALADSLHLTAGKCRQVGPMKPCLEPDLQRRLLRDAQLALHLARFLGHLGAAHRRASAPLEPSGSASSCCVPSVQWKRS